MNIPIPNLSSFLVPPPGEVVIVSNGKYYFTNPKATPTRLTPVSQSALNVAQNKQAAAIQAMLYNSGMSQAAMGVFIGNETPTMAGLLPCPAGALVTVNTSMQLLAWARPFQPPFTNLGYQPILANAPSSPNFPTVGMTMNAQNQFISTGQVIDPGATTTSGIVIPAEPDTPSANPLPSGIYVGASYHLGDGTLAYQTNQDDTQPDQGQVLWLNSANNGAPRGFYQKHIISTDLPVEGSQGARQIYYKAIPAPADISNLPIG